MDRVQALDGITLTDEQGTAARAGGHVRIRGTAGTGKTTALIARYVALVDLHPASEILVLCRDRAGADRFRQSVLGHLAGGFDALPVTTFAGLAFDVAVRHDGQVEVLTHEERLDEISRLLDGDGAAEWPTLHRYLGRRAFVDQVARALDELETSLLVDAPTASPAWNELSAFAPRYRAALAASGTTDVAALAARAATLIDARYRHVLVDDYESPSPADDHVLVRLAQLGATMAVAGNPPAAVDVGTAPVLDVELTRCFRDPGAPRLVVCNHPALEGEAIAGELLAARQEGREWGDMAVLVRASGGRAGAITRALARHHIPTDDATTVADDEPVVRAIIDMLRWADGDAGALDRLLPSPMFPPDSPDRLESLVALRDDLIRAAPTTTPADLAFEVWRRGLPHLAPTATDTTLDAVVGFIGFLQRRAGRRPSERLHEFLALAGGRPGARRRAARSAWGPEADAVTVTTIANAAGRQWRTVVIAGCVEGELPRLRSHASLFDPARLTGAEPPSAVQSQQQRLDAERALFRSACDRSTHQIIGTVAANPGALPSRFVESWATSEPILVEPPGPAPETVAATTGLAPACPDGRLHLSASRLSTYDDCPLRFAYEYVLGARSDTNVWASLGSLVHDVLAEFLDPETAGDDLSRERLLAVAQRHWRDDIAPYRPQVEEIRRDFFKMLDDWWAEEGGDSPLRPEVLAVERGFEIEVGPHAVTGYIDRIDRADDGAGIRVVDYKTGRTKPNAAELADNIQLAVYHLGATRDPELTALGAPTQLRLLYLRDMRTLEQEVTADHAATTEARVLSTADQILDEQFAPSVDADCRHCSYHRLCPLQDEGRQVASR